MDKNNTNNIDKNPPSTVREIGIHLIYISQEITELRTTMKDLPNGFASIKDLAGVESRVGKLETKQNFKATLLWVGLVASAIINIVMVYDSFGGR